MKFELHIKAVKFFVIYTKSEVIKNRIASKNAHKTFIRQNQYESLLGTFINKKDQNQEIKDHVKHDKIYHPVALDTYQKFLNHIYIKMLKFNQQDLL